MSNYSNYYPYGDYKSNEKANDFIIFPLKMTTELSEQLDNITTQNELTLNVNGETETGTLKLDNLKEFDVVFSSSSPSLEERQLWKLRPQSGRVDNLGSFKHKIVARATNNSYGMTKKRIENIEDEHKRNAAKELKCDKSGGKMAPIRGTGDPKMPRSEKLKKIVMHLIAPRPITMDVLQLKLTRLQCKDATRELLTDILKPMCKINSNYEYQLNSNLFANIDDNWAEYEHYERRNIASLKSMHSQTKSQSKSISPDSSSNYNNSSQPKQSFALEKKIAALDMIKNGATFKDTCYKLRIPDNLLSNWRQHEHKLRQMYDQSKIKVCAETDKIKTSSYNPFLSKTNVNNKENNGSSTTTAKPTEPVIADDKSSADEGFDSGSDKISPNSTGSNAESLSRKRPNEDDSKDLYLGKFKRQKTSESFNPFQPKNALSASSAAVSLSKPIDNNRSQSKESHIHKRTNHNLDSYNTTSHSSNKCNSAGSSSSREVTPKSDISVNHSNNDTNNTNTKSINKLALTCPNQSTKSTTESSNFSVPSNNYNIKNEQLTPEYIAKTQDKYKAAFEEYYKLRQKILNKDKQIIVLKQKCLNKEDNIEVLSRLSRAMLIELESPDFQKLSKRFYELEKEMNRYLRILKPLWNNSNSKNHRLSQSVRQKVTQ